MTDQPPPSNPDPSPKPDRHRLRFCPDCGTDGQGRDTCPHCARTLLSSTGLAAALAESVAVRAAGRLGRGYRWVQADRRRFRRARAVGVVGAVLLVSGTSFAAGAGLGGDDDHDGDHGRTSISAEQHQNGDQQHED